MTEQRPKGYASQTSPPPTKPEGQACINAMIELHKEVIGGTGFAVTSKTLASDKFSIDDGCIFYTIDTQGDAAADDLSSIEVALGSYLRDGHVIGLKVEDLSHVVTIKNNVGSTKKILLRNNADYTPTSLLEIIWLQYRESADAWYQIFPDFTQLLNRMLGAKAASTLAISSNQITPASWLVLLNSAADADLNQALTTNFPDDGPLLMLGWSSAANKIRTIKNNTGGSVAGKFYNNGSADIVLDSSTKYVLYYRTTVSSLPAWQEIARFGFGLPTNPALGDVYVGNGSGGYQVPSGTPSDGQALVWDSADAKRVKWGSVGGSMAVSTKTTSFNVGSATNTRFVCDTATNGGDIVATYNVATSGNNQDGNEFVRLGPYNLKLVPYTGEKIIDESGSYDDYSFNNGMNGSRRVRTLHVTGGVLVG